MRYGLCFPMVTALVGAMLALSAPAHAYQILVNTNQMTLDEARNALLLKHEGTWAVTTNSPAGMNWPGVLSALGPGRVITEDVINYPPYDTNPTLDYNAVRSYGASVTAAMVYQEFNNPAWLVNDTCLSDRQVNEQAPTHGSRILLLSRDFKNNPYQRNLKAAIGNSHVTGACFEFVPDITYMETRGLVDGIKYVLGQGKDCYLLMAPGPETKGITLMDAVAKTMRYLHAKRVTIDSNRLYIVPAVYDRNRWGIPFLKKDGGDNSLQAALDWLFIYRYYGYR